MDTMIPAQSPTTADTHHQIDIYFSIDGELIPFAEFGDTREDEIMKRTAWMVGEEVGLIKCPIHHQTASTLTFVQSGNGKYLSYEVDGCCRKLVNRVKRQLR